VTYTFLHQQFQELFAALQLKHELAEIVTTGTGRDDFAAHYVNEPAWMLPVEMLAEFIGRHTEDEPLPNAVAIGQALVEMALPLDPVFAANLADSGAHHLHCRHQGPREKCGPEQFGAELRAGN
jgi:hypothetical protein